MGGAFQEEKAGDREATTNESMKSELSSDCLNLLFNEKRACNFIVTAQLAKF